MHCTQSHAWECTPSIKQIQYFIHYLQFAGRVKRTMDVMRIVPCAFARIFGSKFCSFILELLSINNDLYRKERITSPTTNWLKDQQNSLVAQWFNEMDHSQVRGEVYLISVLKRLNVSWRECEAAERPVCLESCANELSYELNRFKNEAGMNYGPWERVNCNRFQTSWCTLRTREVRLLTWSTSGSRRSCEESKEMSN